MLPGTEIFRRIVIMHHFVLRLNILYCSLSGLIEHTEVLIWNFYRMNLDSSNLR